MIQVASLERTCLACPAQWEGRTDHGNPVTIRYRWGTLRVKIDGQILYEQRVGDPLDGYMDLEELRGHLRAVATLPLEERERSEI